MSNYLETLVEKMVADGVSEKDIKSVIEEVNSKKSPLHQGISGTTGTSVGEGPTIGVSSGDVSTQTTAQPTTQTTVQPTTEETEDLTEKQKCEAKEMCWDPLQPGDENRGNCNECQEDIVDEEEEDIDFEDEEEEDDIILDEEDQEIETQEIQPLYNPEESIEQNVINIQEQINPETQDLNSFLKT